ncbi:hypothetical protein ABW19_dt0204543 [Dactylella cylindrospora]|nr:hypothetical protein ABW19_dt0204543 [Dactylella cylindrospora]
MCYKTYYFTQCGHKDAQSTPNGCRYQQYHYANPNSTLSYPNRYSYRYSSSYASLPPDCVAWAGNEDMMEALCEACYGYEIGRWDYAMFRAKVNQQQQRYRMVMDEGSSY